MVKATDDVKDAELYGLRVTSVQWDLPRHDKTQKRLHLMAMQKVLVKVLGGTKVAVEEWLDAGQGKFVRMFPLNFSADSCAGSFANQGGINSP